MNVVMLLAGFFSLSGCATPSDSQSHSPKANLTQVKIGMTTEQVVSLLGRPARRKELVEAGGTTVQWIYPESQFWTTGDAIRAGLQESAGQRPGGEGFFTLIFKNNTLSSIESQGN